MDRTSRFHIPIHRPGFWVVALIQTLILVWVITQSNEAQSRVDLSDWIRWYAVVAGMTHGMFSSFLWWSSRFDRRFTRWCVVTLAGCGASLVLHLFNGGPFPRYVSMFAGLAIMQSLFFGVGGIPRWRSGLSRETDDSSGPKSHAKSLQQSKLSVADLLAMTMGTAIVFAMAKVYQPPFGLNGNGGEQAEREIFNQYWLGVIMIWCWLPSLSFCLAGTVSYQRLRSILFAAIGAGILGCGGVISLGMLEAGNLSTVDQIIIDGNYLLLTLMYGMSFLAIGLVERIGSRGEGAKEEEWKT